MKNLFCFGLGYTASFTADYFIKKGWIVTGTSRDISNFNNINNKINLISYDPKNTKSEFIKHIKDIDILLISIPPDTGGDIILQHNNPDIIEIFKNKIERVIYLSTTAVYGDTGGKAIDETYQTHPQSDRAINRLKAENAWVDLAKKFDVTYDILRLSGIYGNERNQLINLVKGTAKRIIKEGHVFNRIHVEDIAQIIYKLSISELSSDIYNISDDFPAPPQDVVEYAAKKLNLSPPPEIAFETAKLTPMARSFYSETKIIVNSKIKRALNSDLIFPNYKSGINNILSIHYKKTS